MMPLGSGIAAHTPIVLPPMITPLTRTASILARPFSLLIRANSSMSSPSFITPSYASPRVCASYTLS